MTSCSDPSDMGVRRGRGQNEHLPHCCCCCQNSWKMGLRTKRF